MRSRKQIIYVSFYSACIFYITILSRAPALAHTVKPIPLWSYLDWLRGNQSRGLSILLNIILFTPLGYMLASGKKRKWIPVGLCFLSSVSIEIIQYLTYRGFFDIDDIISNCIGGAGGALIYRAVGERFNKWHVPALLLLAGIIGCIITSGNRQIYETQFDFRILSVEVQGNSITLSGVCDIYRRGFVPYQIQLKDDDGTYIASTETDGTQFIATTNVPIGVYEIDVLFQGYPPISTNTYICGDQVQFVPNAPIPDIIATDLAFLLNAGIIKVYNAEYDTYVYQVDNNLYWIIGADFVDSIIYHLYTEEPENLPEERKRYGFDNRGFGNGSEKEITNTINCGKYRVFRDIIPNEYSVTAVVVGMNKGPDVFWSQYFRVY